MIAVIKTLYRIFIGSLILSLSACDLIIPDPEPPAVIVEPTPQPTPIAEPIPIAPDNCQTRCESKSGLKKKICLKKCDIEHKRALAKKVKPPEW